MTYVMLKILICLTAVTFVSVTASTCQLDPLYPYGEAVGDSVLNHGDDEHVFVELDSSFNFWGADYSTVYVNINGLISFESGIRVYEFNEVYQYGPFAAIFFVDMELTQKSGSKILYRQANLTKEPELVTLVQKDTEHFGQAITPQLVFIATWKEALGVWDNDMNNTFQFVLASDGNKTFMIYNYGLLRYFESLYALLTFCDRDGNGKPYFISASSAMKNISDFTNVDFPGRIVTRVDGTITLGGLKLSPCQSCLIDRDSGLVKTFDGSEDLNVHENDRKFLISKESQAVEQDECKYMLRATTNENGIVDWVAISVGIHPKRPNSYKRNFAFERNLPDQVLARGHQLKQTITSFPYYEFISDDRQQLSVAVEKTPGGWVVRSPSCQYKMTYHPLDASNQLVLTVSQYYKNNTVGMCQNNNFIREDDNMTCMGPQETGNSSEIADSCSCPRRDKACNKALARF